MTTKPLLIDIQETAASALSLMQTVGLRHLVVSSGGAPIGVLSMNDFPKLIKPHLLVAHIATLNGVIAINQSSTIEYARSVLDVNGIGILPIVDDLGRLVGVVTRQDLDLYI